MRVRDTCTAALEESQPSPAFSVNPTQTDGPVLHLPSYRPSLFHCPPRSRSHLKHRNRHHMEEVCTKLCGAHLYTQEPQARQAPSPGVKLFPTPELAISLWSRQIISHPTM